MRFRGLNAAVECFLDTLYVLLLASRLRLWRGLLTTPRLAPLTFLICKPFFFLLGFEEDFAIDLVVGFTVSSSSISKLLSAFFFLFGFGADFAVDLVFGLAVNLAVGSEAVLLLFLGGLVVSTQSLSASELLRKSSLVRLSRMSSPVHLGWLSDIARASLSSSALRALLTSMILLWSVNTSIELLIHIYNREMKTTGPPCDRLE